MAYALIILFFRLAVLGCSLAGLGACSSSVSGGQHRDYGIAGGIFSNTEARQPTPTRGSENNGTGLVATGGAGAQRAFASGAAGAEQADRALAMEPAGAQTYAVNFDNAPIADVVRSVLNDALQLNYTMSSDVQGNVTISSVRPVSRSQLLSTLETVLDLQGLSMTKTAEGYRIGPSAVGGGNVDMGSRTRPGNGISIVPLRFVSAATMTRLLSGFIVNDEDMRIAATQNAIFVRGTSAARADAVKTILSFDADWMKDQSVALLEVTRVRPEVIVPELEKIFASEGGTGAIEFKPITRLRAVMALSKNQTLIRRAETWVKRLDQESAATGDNVFVFRPRYRDAKDLARIASSLFGAASTATPQDRTAPASRGFATTDDQAGGDDSSFQSGSSDLVAAPAAADADADTTGDAAGTAAPDQQQPPAEIDLTRLGPGAKGPTIRISADMANNSVITYTDGETYTKVLAALRSLDSTPLQVAINVTIAEVRLNDELRYGIQYFVKSGSLDVGQPGSVSLFSEAASTLQKEIPGFNFLVGTNANPDLVISALDRITDVQVLSSPSLVVLENQTAALQVGDEVPITVRQAQSLQDPTAPIVNQIEFRNTGILLNVTPRIGQNDAVTMKIAQEISNVNGGQNTLTPTISKRRIESSISVISGQTVLLAGLISQSRDNGKSGVPGLSRVPGLGKLFSTTTKASGRTELVVLIRPVVVHNGEDAESVAEEFRSKLQTVGQEPRYQQVPPVVTARPAARARPVVRLPPAGLPPVDLPPVDLPPVTVAPVVVR